MGRAPRAPISDQVYHIINRANGRAPLFNKDGDYLAFERILFEAKIKFPIRLLAYCIMPNHWHFVLWTRNGPDLPKFMRWLTLTHAQRWHAHYHSIGNGHLYQGRYKSFPVQHDDHLLRVCRYVERNALRARLVGRAEAWRWGSAFLRLRPDRGDTLLDAWPVPLPENYVAWLNDSIPSNENELDMIRNSVNRGAPFGMDAWKTSVADTHGLATTLRPRGRPRKGT